MASNQVKNNTLSDKQEISRSPFPAGIHPHSPDEIPDGDMPVVLASENVKTVVESSYEANGYFDRDAQIEKKRQELIRRVDQELSRLNEQDRPDPALKKSIPSSPKSSEEYLLQARAHKEITDKGIDIQKDSTVDSLLVRLQQGAKAWLGNALTRFYIQAAIERANMPKEEWAYREITSLGVAISPDEPVESILKQINEKGNPWKDDGTTMRYIQEALDFKKNSKEDGKAVQEKEKDEKRAIKFLAPELWPDDGRSLYLGQHAMEQYGVKAGERIWIKTDDRVVWASVADAAVRDDGSTEDFNSPYMRMSEHLITGDGQDETGKYRGLGFPKGAAFIPHVVERAEHMGEKELRLEPPDAKEKDSVKLQKLRTVQTEIDANGTTALFLKESEQKLLGVSPGDTISIRFGKLRIGDVRVAEESEDNKDGRLHWKFRTSQENKEKLDALVGFPLRSKFDKRAKELTLGIGVVYTISKNLPENGHELFEALTELGNEYGVFTCVIPNVEGLTYYSAQNGFVEGYVYKNGVYEKRTIPLPDVLYNREGKVNNSFKDAFEHTLIPKRFARVARNKLRFAEAMVESGLERYHPMTKKLFFYKPEELEDMLKAENEIVLKPQEGASGKGILFVRKDNNGKYFIKTAGSKQQTQLDTVQEVLEELEKIRIAEKENLGEFIPYIMQKKVDMIDYYYKDPRTGVDLIGKPEPRVWVYRMPNGDVNVGGIVARIFNNASEIPHMEDIKVVAQQAYGDRWQEKVAAICKLSIGVFRAVEKKGNMTRGKDDLCELTVDLALASEDEPMVLEANDNGENRQNFVFRRWGQDQDIVLKDGRYNTVAAPIQNALRLTNM